MGTWNAIGSAAQSRKRLVHTVPTAEEAAASDARFRAMAAEGRAPLAAVAWREDSALQATGRIFDSRAKYQAFLKSRNLVEVNPKNPSEGISRPKVDREAIIKNAFELGRRDISQGKPISVPTQDRPMGGVTIDLNKFRTNDSIENVKRDSVPGGRFGGDTGFIDATNVTQPKLIPGTASTMDAERAAFNRMNDRLEERTGERWQAAG